MPTSANHIHKRCVSTAHLAAREMIMSEYSCIYLVHFVKRQKVLDTEAVVEPGVGHKVFSAPKRMNRSLVTGYGSVLSVHSFWTSRTSIISRPWNCRDLLNTKSILENMTTFFSTSTSKKYTFLTRQGRGEVKKLIKSFPDIAGGDENHW
jgi:hypothetical protein